MSSPCARPECGGEVHTDPWGKAARCQHAEPEADTGRRCPRCDCADGHTQCEHCKVCPHATAEEQLMPEPDRDRPRASVIEIIATGRAPAEDGARSIIVPREVRINGVSVFTADRDNRIKVSDISLGDNMVEVTLTLVARRLVIAHEDELDGGTP